MNNREIKKQDMNSIKIKNAFDKGKALIGFVTGGDPSIEKSEEFILKMVEAGCDVVEIGIPFSDPIAEGTVIQEANIRALTAGATTDKMFELAARVREKTEVPLVFVTYLNPVFCYGYEKFCAKCAQAGISGIVIPDMPYEEKGELMPCAKKYDIDIISFIAPADESRIKTIALEAAGFMIADDRKAVIDIVKSVSAIPIAVEPEESTPEQASIIVQTADGVMVGNAIVKLIEKYGDNAGEHVYEYVKHMKNAIMQVKN